MSAVRESPASAGQPVVLQGEAITCRFGGLTAVDAVDFDVRHGEIFGLIGPNGAGKTTLMNAISGVTPVAAGRIIFDGGTITGLPPHEIARRGIARTFQVMRPFTGLTVRENVAIGARFGKTGGPRSMRAALQKADHEEKLAALTGHTFAPARAGADED